ncbi:MAG: hypothetical protein EXR55_02985 [Dehalococcoidia bacterium]|nr:hypothetical protein [Dehalococcoidia bacterium]
MEATDSASALQPGFPWRRAALAALWASVALTASTWLAVRLLGVEAPFQTLADQLSLWLPPRVFSFLLFNLQHWAKPLLLLGLAGAWSALGAAIALVIWRAAWPSGKSATSSSTVPIMVGGALLWLLSAGLLSPLAGAGFAGSSSPAGALRWSLAALLPLVLYCWIIHLQRPHRPTVSRPAPTSPSNPLFDQPTPDVQPPSLARRGFLVQAGIAVIAIAGSALLLRDAIKLSRGVAESDATKAEEAIAEPSEPQVDLAVTPASRFYVVSKNFSDPRINADQWGLTVVGHVQNPYALSYSDMIAMPARQQYVTLECISNQIGGDLISNALWTGIPLATFIERARPLADAAFVVTRSEDGYSESLPIEVAMDPDVLLVYELNGAPLAPPHGFPLRLLVPGRYGMKSTKWLTEIEVTAKYRPGYWEQRGWDEEAVVKAMSKIDYPHSGAQIPLDPITVGGVAFAGNRGVQRVEISADDGAAWQPATVEPALSQYTWVRWSTVWRPPSQGNYTLLVRATEPTGQVQTSTDSGDFPDGASGYDSIRITVV